MSIVPVRSAQLIDALSQLPEERDPCQYTRLILPFVWVSVREDIESLRDPHDPSLDPVAVDLLRGTRYRSVRAEVLVQGHDRPFSWILVHAPLYACKGSFRWLGLHEKIFIKKGATFHETQRQ